MQEIVIRAFAEIAAFGRNNAGGNGSPKSVGISHGRDPLPNLRPFLRKRDKGKLLVLIDFEKCNIGSFVFPNHLRLEGLTIIRNHPDLGGAVDNMVVGHDIAIG